MDPRFTPQSYQLSHRETTQILTGPSLNSLICELNHRYNPNCSSSSSSSSSSSAGL